MRTSIPPAGDPPVASHTIPEDWRHRAACRDEYPELFFPASSPASQRYTVEVAEAKAVCRRCPVASECLSHALATRSDEGVFGGLDAEERRALRRAEPRVEPVAAAADRPRRTRIDLAQVAALRALGWGFDDIARRLGVLPTSLRRAELRARGWRRSS